MNLVIRSPLSYTQAEQVFDRLRTHDKVLTAFMVVDDKESIMEREIFLALKQPCDITPDVSSIFSAEKLDSGFHVGSFGN